MGEAERRAGQGRLAEVLATRGGQATAEAPFVIEHREALIYMLCEAAELEHGIMCQYLFAAFSLKQQLDEGLTDEQLGCGQPLAEDDPARRRRGDAAPRARAQRAVRNRVSAAPRAPEPPGAREPLPGRSRTHAGPVRRRRAAALHVPRAPGGHGVGRRQGHRRAAARRGSADERARHRPAAAGLRDRGAPLSLDRAGSRPAVREVRRAQPVHWAPGCAGRGRALPLERASAGHRPCERAAGARHDPRAGRGSPRRLEGRAFRAVRRDLG